VLAVVSEKAANEILDGKTELGANAAAAAGPTGAQANGYTASGSVEVFAVEGVFIPDASRRPARYGTNAFAP
jgi:lipid-binding SYLF domain-containing protein